MTTRPSYRSKDYGLSLQGLCSKSGATSDGGFSTGYSTVTKRPFSEDDEKLDTLGNKYSKIKQPKDDPVIGPSYTTNYEGNKYTRPRSITFGQ
jgi:hypothetical protein